jgi:hypothetical protein
MSKKLFNYVRELKVRAEILLDNSMVRLVALCRIESKVW